MKRVLLLLLIAISIYSKSFSQYAKGQIKEDFYWAETFVLYEEYKDALELYLRLARIDPTNFNYKYRIGQCMINIPGRKQEALSYLEDAVKNINPKYKEGKIKENKAPYDAYYYLANAYRVNNQLPKAIATYELFKKNLDPAVYDTAIVNLQIESCRNALELMKKPLFVKKINLGPAINSRFAENNPVVSGDENVMIYNKVVLQEGIYCTRKVNGIWSEPVNIVPNFGADMEDNNFPTCLSYDGKELYIYRPGADFDGNIFVTKWLGGDKWTPLKKLNENVNTKYWESHAAISHDGKKLYFTSNRKGGFEGLDIYVTERDSADNWGPAKNLGSVINTKYNEDTPFLGKDDKTLFFSSRGHFNIGGYDIFYSTLQDNEQWSVPLNLGFPVNSTDDDIFFDPVKDGYQAYYALIDSGGYGSTDIYKIEIFSKEHPRKFFVRGIVQVKDLMSMFKDSIKVSALNIEDPNARVIVYTNPETGEYKFELPQGKYVITYEASGAEKIMNNVDLPLTNPADSFVLPGTTLPKTDFAADLNVEANKNMSVIKGDTVAIPMRVEPNSVLVVEHWLGDSLLYSEKYVITDTSFIYKTVPQTGNNKLVFKLTDKYSNTTTSEVFISRQKVITEQPVVRPEYSRVIAQKQISALVNMMINRADADLKKVIKQSDFKHQQFGKIDDLISYIKEEAAKKNISSAEVDKLALKVAVMDNVLTQAAVDLVASKVDGELKDLLKNLSIDAAGLKTWTDLQNYISEKSNGRIQPEDLNKIASDILNDIDPSIRIIREKVLIYSDKNPKGSQINRAVMITDQKTYNKAGNWLKSVYTESINEKLTDQEMANLFSALTSMPAIEPGKYLEELAGFGDESFAGYLRKMDLKKARIKVPADLMLYLLNNKDKGQYEPDAMFSCIARMIAAKDLTPEVIASNLELKEKPDYLILWLLVGTGLIIFIIIILRRKRKKEDNKGIEK